MALGPVSFAGIGSGFDIKSIITAILNVEHLPVDRLHQRQTGIDDKRTAWNDLGTRLASLRAALLDLSNPAGLGARTAGSSDEGILTATASASAELGTHEIEVRTLARAERVRSESIAGRFDPAITDGTITIRSGSRDPITINVSAASGNNNLAAVRDAINAAGEGVAASIVNDGSKDLLVLRATTAGTANAFTITDSTNLNLDSADNVLENASNATVVVDGVTVTSGTNTLTSALPGLSLSLVSAEPGTTITLTVGADVAGAKDKIAKFVAAYNDVAGFLKGQSTADEKTGKAGVLAGDALLRRVQELLTSSVSGAVPGLPSSALTTLGAAGIAIEGASGKLKIDDAKLTAALTDHYDETLRLFAAAGRATDAAASFGGVSSATAAGTYAITVTAAPERATLLAATAIGPSGLAQAETLTIGVGGASASIALGQGDTLTTVVGKLNAGLASAGVSARATNDGGRLRLSSVGYGSGASLTAVSDVADAGDGTSTGVGTIPQTDTGADIAGLIGGVAALGTGTVLTGATGTPAEGLAISIVTDPATVAAKSGDFGSITVSRGVADTLARAVKSIADPVGGLIAGTVSRFDDETRRISDQIAQIEARLKDREIFLTLQFDAADRAIQSLQAQQSALGKSYSLI